MDRLHALAVTWEGATPASWGIVLHGIYGRGRNWAAVARQVAAARPEWGFWLLDLRLHGESPAMAPPHTVARTAEDVVAFARTIERPATIRAIVGHSFGGKVALSAAVPLADSVAQVWMVDSMLEAREPSGSAWAMLAIVRALAGPFATRADALRALDGQGLSPDVAAWMASNLRRGDRGLTWSLDIDALEGLLRDFFATDLWPIVEQLPGRLSLHVVKAADSSSVSDTVAARLDALQRTTDRVHLHRVAGGHWVNSENPAAVVDLLVRHLPPR